jgi:regulator of sigma E protease
LTFIAFYSVSLGLMNLLPIPMLDGGHLLYYLVEIMQGRPPSERFLEMSQRAGMAVLACLMSVALFNDFSRLLS